MNFRFLDEVAARSPRRCPHFSWPPDPKVAACCENFSYSFKGTASPRPQLAVLRFLAPLRDAMPRVAEGVAD